LLFNKSGEEKGLRREGGGEEAGMLEKLRHEKGSGREKSLQEGESFGV